MLKNIAKEKIEFALYGLKGTDPHSGQGLIVSSHGYNEKEFDQGLFPTEAELTDREIKARMSAQNGRTTLAVFYKGGLDYKNRLTMIYQVLCFNSTKVDKQNILELIQDKNSPISIKFAGCQASEAYEHATKPAKYVDRVKVTPWVPDVKYHRFSKVVSRNEVFFDCISALASSIAKKFANLTGEIIRSKENVSFNSDYSIEDIKRYIKNYQLGERLNPCSDKSLTDNNEPIDNRNITKGETKNCNKSDATEMIRQACNDDIYLKAIKWVILVLLSYFCVVLYSILFNDSENKENSLIDKDRNISQSAYMPKMSELSLTLKNAVYNQRDNTIKIQGVAKNVNNQMVYIVLLNREKKYHFHSIRLNNDGEWSDTLYAADTIVDTDAPKGVIVNAVQIPLERKHEIQNYILKKAPEVLPAYVSLLSNTILNHSTKHSESAQIDSLNHIVKVDPDPVVSLQSGDKLYFTVDGRVKYVFIRLLSRNQFQDNEYLVEEALTPSNILAVSKGTVVYSVDSDMRSIERILVYPIKKYEGKAVVDKGNNRFTVTGVELRKSLNILSGRL